MSTARLTFSVVVVLLLTTSMATVVLASTPVRNFGTCNARCGVVYSNVTCINDTRCEWWNAPPTMAANFTDTNNATCQEKCILVANRAPCMMLPHCFWNFGTKTCQRACKTYLTANCTSDNGCQVARDGISCVPKCTSLTNRPSCNSFWPSCSYNTSNSTCVPGCGFINKDACVASIGCVWLRALNLCAPECVSSSSSISTCGINETFYCSWKDGKCKERCDYKFMTADLCTSSDCDTYVSTTPYTCQDNCLSIGLNETGCNLNPRCIFDERWSQCRKHCSEIIDSNTCANSGYCDWTRELGCIKKCHVGVQNTTKEQINCVQKSWCYFDVVDKVCALRCRRKYYDLQQPSYVGYCNSDLRCTAVGDSCREVCARLDPVTCRSMERCFFNGTSCEDRCDAATTADSCTLRPSCEWEPGRQQCREVCSLFKYDAAVCGGYETIAHCVWLGINSTCGTGCALTSCSAAHCQASGSDCLTKCMYLDQSQCNGVARCSWASDVGVCKDACSLLYANSVASCNADPQCAYLAGRGECNELCSRWNKNATLCLMNSHCKYDYGNRSCSVTCSAGYSGPTSDCVNAANCMPSGASSLCLTQCWNYNKTGCGFQLDCIWNATTAQCDIGCEARYNFTDRVLAQTSCDADARCQWRANVPFVIAKCGQRCSLVSTGATNCSTVSADCVWTNATNATLNANVTNPDGTVYLGTCRTPCVSRGSLASCEGVDGGECQWYDMMAACLPSCRLLPNISACSDAAPFCMWRGRLGICESNCETRYTNLRRCRADAMCSQSNGGFCTNRCDKLHSLACRTSSSCMWSGTQLYINTFDANGVCAAKCGDRQLFECAFDDQCFVANGTTCSSKCSTFGDAITCESQSGICNWNAITLRCDVACRLKYMQQLTSELQGNCTADINCQWNTGFSRCDPACHTVPLNVPILPVSNALSRYPNRYYAKNDCGSFTACTSAMNMYSQIVTCTNSRCSSQLSNSTCVPQAGCTWTDVSTSTKCILDCSVFNAVTCPTSGSDCILLNGACQITCTRKYGSNNTGCGNDINCFWDAGSSTCLTNCSRFTADACGAYIVLYDGVTTTQVNTHCSWNQSASTCGLACSRLLSSTSCSVPGCYWRLTPSTSCVADCRGLGNTTCLQLSHCSWNAESKKCLNNCNIKYYKDTAIVDANQREDLFKANCSADPDGCMWGKDSGDVTVCMFSCSAGIRSNCGSGIYSNCVWSERDNICIPKCSSRWANFATNETFCRADSSCRPSYNSSATCQNLCDVLIAPKLTNCSSYHSDCLFDYNQTKCIPSCISRLAVSKRTSNCSTLPANECFLSGYGCVETCLSMQSTYDLSLDRSCTAANQCRMGTSGYCELNCGNFSIESDCNATSSCLWINGGSCVTRCPSILSNVSCLRQSHCRWHPTLQVCRSRCGSFYNYYSNVMQSNCQTDTNCEWMSWQVTIPNGTSPYQVTRGGCFERCYQLEYSLCVASGGDCIWNSQSRTCRRACSTKYYTSSGCAADNACMWYGDKCWEKCSIQSPSMCAQLPNCVYADALRSCTTRCDQRYKNFTLTPADTYISDCTADADCVIGKWDTGASKCYLKCSIFDRVGCGVNTYCMWNDLTSKCIQGCDSRYRELLYVVNATYVPYNTSCAADPEGVCLVGRRGAGWECDATCKFLITAKSCQNVTNCLWYEKTGTCARKCATRYDTVNTVDCNKDLDCREGCQDRCDYQVSMEGCEAVTNCKWRNNTCFPACTGVPTKLSCLSAALRCDWDDINGRCYEECSSYNASRCNIDGFNCYWNDVTSSCMKWTCSNYLTGTSCMADPDCDWTYSQCRAACKSVNTTAGCSSYPHCEWVEVQSRCAVRCDSRQFSTDADRSGCSVDSHCQWFGRKYYVTGSNFPEKCLLRCDLRNFSSTSCTTVPFGTTTICTWDAITKTCRVNCNAIYTDESTCNADPFCQWKGGPLASLSSCQLNCSLFLSENECSPYSHCTWYDLNRTCRRSCDLSSYLTDTVCNADPFCWWSNFTNNCTRRCNTTGSYSTCSNVKNNVQCSWYNPNATARFSLRTLRYNTTTLKPYFVTGFGVYNENVTITDEGRGCNMSVATVDVNRTDTHTINAIFSGMLLSYIPWSIASDVIEFAEQGTIIISDPNPAAGWSVSVVLTLGTALVVFGSS